MRAQKPPVLRFFKPFLAVALVALGLVLCVIPGPGVPIILIGAGLLADQWRGLARVMDWLEVQLRRAVKSVVKAWTRIPPGAKYAVILLAMALAVGAAYG